MGRRGALTARCEENMADKNEVTVAGEFVRGFRAALPMMLGFVPIALILGATGSQTGLSPLAIGLMCGINFAGGSEFAALALWSAVPPVLAIILTTWLINSRHIMLSAALTPYVAKLPLRKALVVFFIMCDETWALAMQDITKRRQQGMKDAEAFSLAFYLGVGLTLWLNWWGCAAIGAALGSGVGDLSAWGIGMAFPVIFISILASMWPGAKKCLPWGVSAVAAGLASLVWSSGVSVAVGSLAGLAAAWILIMTEGDYV